MNMKLKNTAIVVVAAITLIITGSFVAAPTTAFAIGESWDVGGLSGGDYYDYTPISTWGYTGGSDYYDYTPISSYGYSSYPSYSSYTPSSSGYSSYVPSSSGYSYSPASTPSYSYSPTPASNYSYTPSTSSVYSYSPSTSSSKSTSAATASNWTYVSNANTNTNTNTLSNTNTLNQTYNPTNTNVYTPTNVFNPVNNNDARINLIVLGGGGSTGTTNTNNLSVNCVINPSIAYVNQNVTFTANASGGNGSYTYSWSGSDGISASGQSFTGMFSYTGTKTATVTVTSNGQTASASCNTTVQGNTYNNQTAYCVANPTNGVVGQNVTWTAYTSNNQYGSYGSTYQWSGSDNLYGSGQTISHVYNTPGYHTANVTIYSNGQTSTATCSTNINGYNYTGGATVIRDTTTPVSGTPVAGVFLNQVPATGISFGLKMTLFTVGLLMWSLFAAYIVSVKRKAKLAGFDGSFGFGNTAGAGSNNVVARINAFKEANLRKKNLI